MSPISEEELRARLRDVQPRPASSGYAEHLVHQGRFRRRRQRWMTGIAAAAVVAVIGGGALVLGDQLGRETALPATPAPTPKQPEITPTATSTNSPTGTTTPSPTNTPSTTTTGASLTPSPSSTPSRSVTLKAVTLLHEGSSTPSAVWDICSTSGRTVAARHGAVETRAISVTVSEGEDGAAEALLGFPSADEAVAYMGELRQVARACEDATDGAQRGLVENLPGTWGEGLALGTASRLEQETGVLYYGASVTLAVRSGSAVALSQQGGHAVMADRVPEDLVARARPAVEHVAPQLCRYTEAGC